MSLRQFMPWNRQKIPFEPATAPGAAQDNRPRLLDICAEPILYHGVPVKWKINVIFDRKVLTVGVLSDQNRANETVAKMREGLL